MNLGFIGPAGSVRVRGRGLLARRVSELPIQVELAAKRLAGSENEKARLVNLIALGEGRHDEIEEGHGQKVPGCTAVVRIEVTVDDGTLTKVLGSADAKLARGLLALLQESLVGLRVSQVLALECDSILSAAGLGSSPVAKLQTGLSAMLASIKKAVTPRPDTTEAVSPISWPGQEVAVLLSGGVDSSVALRLVQERGDTPVPFYLRIWLEDELAHLGSCPWEDDTEAAEAVCAQAGVKLETVPMQRQYWDSVVQYTVDEARRGRTPNPDVMCNSRVKFGAFYDAIGKDFEKIATGHYAQTRLDSSTGKTQLITSADDWKDQTYFLSHLNQHQVSKANFPIGHLRKEQVRDLAENVYRLPNASRPDSQGICFLGKLPFDQFLEHYLGVQNGPLVDFDSGVILGEHRGFWFYTLGQRKGIGLSGGPWYVVTKNPKSNVVYVSRNYQAVDKTRDFFAVESLSWILGTAPSAEQLRDPHLEVKVRHGPGRHAIAEMVVDTKQPDRATVRLTTRDKGLAPGQFAAFYLRDVCIGSGVIALEETPTSEVPVVTGVRSRVRLQAHFTSG